MTICTVDACGRSAKARGLCAGHYKRSADGRSMAEPLHFRQRRIERRIEGDLYECTKCREMKPAVGFGSDPTMRGRVASKCNTCRNTAAREREIPLRARRPEIEFELATRGWSDLATYEYNGYQRVNYKHLVFQVHRLIKAVALGRPLRRNETVHHKNGNGMDNRPSNLQLRHGQHGSGVVLICNVCGSDNVSPAALPRIRTISHKMAVDALHTKDIQPIFHSSPETIREAA